MGFTSVQIDSMISKIAAGTEKTSVDGLLVETNLGALMQAVRFAQTIGATEDRSRRPFRMDVFRSPGGISR